MAHERLSPRQKMIGMMYLILTAMLALNVSKEAVEAFKKVDKSLTTTLANYVIKNNLIYEEFTRAAAENPTKAGKYKSTAFEVKARADEVINYIQDLKKEIIYEAEGPETTAIQGDEVIIEEVKKIDENNVPSQILIGANENGKAFYLKSLINDYREFLISTLDGKNTTAEEALRTSLNTDDGRDPDGQPTRWENMTFHTLPLVAVVTILSKIQVDVRNAETEVLNHLYSQIDAGAFKVNKIVPLVVPNSSYVTLGSDYEAKVFISAVDSTQTPTVTVNGTALPADESGRGIYKVRASSTGIKRWGGVISLKNPSGAIVEYPFESSYNVGEPNVVVSPTAMNVMYKGIWNPIDVSVPGVNPDRIKIRVVGGTVSNERVKNSRGVTFKGNWSINPTAVGQNVQVIVSTTDETGKATPYPPVEFRVKPVPAPIAVFAGKNTGTITKNTAAAQAGVFASMPDFEFDLVYKVTGFTILYTEKGSDFEEQSKSSALTPGQKSLINRLTRGKNLIIKDIKCLAPDGRTLDLSPIILKID
ncbi:MAG: gliding motility protein GldM [Bacteroidales bacterium]|nr:gliding motility protein GldM [Bacteroidales bacterium]